jgi:hypothetical protein
MNQLFQSLEGETLRFSNAWKSSALAAFPFTIHHQPFFPWLA